MKFHTCDHVLCQSINKYINESLLHASGCINYCISIRANTSLNVADCGSLIMYHCINSLVLLKAQVFAKSLFKPVKKDLEFS